MTRVGELKSGRIGIRSFFGSVVSVLVFTAQILFPACAEPVERVNPKSVILISMDTTRFDHMGLYGYSRPTTPILDAIGKRGLVFRNAVTVSENTLISHASLFTGLFPGAHGATPKTDELKPLPSSYRTIAEDFRDAGYQTAGFTAHADWLNVACGMHQGFDTFTSEYREANVLLEEVTEWLSEIDPATPFFLFIHLFDVHSDPIGRPYFAKKPFRGRFTEGYKGPLRKFIKDPKTTGSRLLRAIMNDEIEVDERDLDHLRGQYDEGLAYTDDELGNFLNALTILDDVHVVITADHGEEFMEHGTMLHSSLFDPVVHIPLIWIPPATEAKRFSSPRVIEEQVRLVDIRPSLLALCGIPIPEIMQGVSLIPWLEGKTTDCPSGPAPLYYLGIRHDGFKWLGGRLYDLEADPEELHDVAGEEQHRTRIQGLRSYLKNQEKVDRIIRDAHREDAKGERTELDQAAKDRLRALGY